MLQSALPAEVLLIDDASKDGTLALLHELSKRHGSILRVISMHINVGPGLARNAGWAIATQPWLAFLDADDIWHPQKLEVQWSWLQAHPEVSLCGHSTQLMHADLEGPAPVAFSAAQLSLIQMLITNRLPTRSVMLRRDMVMRFGDKKVTEDYLLWLEAIAHGYVAYRLDVCLAFSIRPDFSPGGYSGQLWAHEKRELAALTRLASTVRLWPGMILLASLWSIIKFMRRYALTRWKR
jgi:glycosyltransferase involved in cell wall biosynthesis